MTAFELTTEQLKDLMQERGEDSLEAFNKIGGAEGIARKLKTDTQNGLSGDVHDIEARQRKFGVNSIPPKKPKTFLELAWEAMQDVTLIVLIICAIISVILAAVHFYVEEAKRQSGGDAKQAQCFEVKVVHSTNHVSDESHWFSKYAEFIEGFAILFAIVIVVLVTAYNDYSKEKQFRGLQEKISEEQTISCLRDGNIEEINVIDLVVGDIVLVKYGDLLPADGMLAQSNDLKIDESSLTGESDLIKKHISRDPALLCGTHVMEGSGKMIVTAVGPNSQSGLIFALLGATETDREVNRRDSAENFKVTPDVEAGQPAAVSASKITTLTTLDDGEEESRSILQMKLDALTVQIYYMGTFFACATIVALTLRLIIEIATTPVYVGTPAGNYTGIPSTDRQPFKDCFGSYLTKFLGFFIIGVTVLVVAIPEGLPLAVTISLAYSVKKMMRDNNLVRHLDACETMGNATAICSDKTGTLTTNRMTVVQSFFAGKFYKECQPNAEVLPQHLKEVMINGISINTNYTSQVLPPVLEGGEPQQIGNKTECALLGFILNIEQDYAEIRQMNPVDSFVKVFTFNSTRKSMTTVIKHKTDPTKFRIYTKGASEIILRKCSEILNNQGEAVQFASQDRYALQKKVIEPMADDSLRTIALAYKDVSNTVDLENEATLLSGMTCIGIVGIEDPVRPEVPSAIKKCQAAGICVRMVTGDNIKTARSIAQKCGIIEPGDEDHLVIEGKTFNRQIRNPDGSVSQSKLDKIWPMLRVLARSSPTDKHTLVKGMIDSKLKPVQVVAVTGDGTNDGPALKKADVGFAMGIAGTDVAKEASDIILTDDNFTSIVRAVLWGRNVYDSISKFLQFQLTVNVVAVIVAFLGAFLVKASPLKAVQMLWVNLIMDTFASLALATEPPTEELLTRKPYPRSKALVSKTMAKNILGHGVFQLIVVFSMLGFPNLLPCNNQCYKDESGLGYGLSATNFTSNLGVTPQWKMEDKASDPSEHFTLIFNVFVQMQIFNEINARKIHRERNVFKGMFNNPMFYCIVLGTLILQYIIVEVGTVIFSCAALGLSFKQWVFCLLVGAFELVWGQLITTIPKSTVDSIAKALIKPPKEEDVECQDQGRALQEKSSSQSISNGKVLWIRSINRVREQLRETRRGSMYQGTCHRNIPVSCKVSCSTHDKFSSIDLTGKTSKQGQDVQNPNVNEFLESIEETKSTPEPVVKPVEVVPDEVKVDVIATDITPMQPTNDRKPENTEIPEALE